MILLIILVAIPMIGQENADMRVVFSSIEEKESTLPIMTKPRFQGVDEKDQPYMVTAAKATQREDDTILLDNVAADLTTNNKAWLALIAQTGILNLQSDTLQLRGNVQLFHDAGHQMTTEKVNIDLNNLSAQGDLPIIIQGEFGRVTSDTFAIKDKGDRMIFKKNVEMLLLP